MATEKKPIEDFPADALARLREPFPENQISIKCQPVKKDNPKGKCPKCGGWHSLPAIPLSYVGHAALTDRLLDVDPFWSWEPLALDANGLPLLDGNGGMWIKLTVCGVTRLGYGDAEGKTGGNAVKERIGDALRNAAMRFGAALELWHKGELHVDEEGDDPKPEAKPTDHRPSEKVPLEALEAHALLQDRMYSAFKAAGKGEKYDAEAKKWRQRMADDNPAEVVKALEIFVAKLEDAAKKTSEANPKAA